jgi:hypothetical protein
LYFEQMRRWSRHRKLVTDRAQWRLLARGNAAQYGDEYDGNDQSA